MQISQKEFFRKKEKFAEYLTPWLLENLDPKIIVRGVSFVPFIRNGTQIILGKERSGTYKNKWNFFGGSLTDKASNPEKPSFQDIAEGLFEEIAEEFGCIVTGPKFIDNLMSVYQATARQKAGSPPVVTLMFIVAMNNFNKEIWREVMEKRKENFSENSCWCEHIDIGSFQEGELNLGVDTSSFVKGFIEKMFSIAKIHQSNYKGMNFQNLKFITQLNL